MVHKMRERENEVEVLLTDSDIGAIVDAMWSKGVMEGLSSDEFDAFYDLLKITEAREG